MKPLRHLSRADAIACGVLDWPAALADIRATLELMRSGAACMVAESVLPLGPDPRNKAYGLPASVGGNYDAAGLKWTLHRAESAAGLPSINSTTFINRLSDGTPLGMVESALLTRVRTAAVSAAALKALRPGGIGSIAVLGAGAQARSHLDMLAVLFPGLSTIHLWNRSPGAWQDMRDSAPAALKGRLVEHDDLRNAVLGAEAVLCCTSAPAPILDLWAVGKGRLILQIGFHEVSFEAIATMDCIIVDLWGDFAEKSAKSLFQMYRAGRFSPAQVDADLSALLLDGWQPPPGASVYFSSFGLNVFDIALAARLLKRAEALQIGTSLPAI